MTIGIDRTLGSNNFLALNVCRPFWYTCVHLRSKTILCRKCFRKQWNFHAPMFENSRTCWKSKKNAWLLWSLTYWYIRAHLAFLIIRFGLVTLYWVDSKVLTSAQEERRAYHNMMPGESNKLLLEEKTVVCYSE